MALNLRALFLRGRNVLAAIATVTPIRSDDALVVLFDAAIDDAELLGFIRQAEEDHDAGRLSLSTSPPVALQESAQALERRGVDWARLIEMLPSIIALIKSLRG